MGSATMDGTINVVKNFFIFNRFIIMGLSIFLIIFIFVVYLVMWWPLCEKYPEFVQDNSPFLSPAISAHLKFVFTVKEGEEGVKMVNTNFLRKFDNDDVVAEIVDRVYGSNYTYEELLWLLFLAHDKVNRNTRCQYINAIVHFHKINSETIGSGLLGLKLFKLTIKAAPNDSKTMKLLTENFKINENKARQLIKVVISEKLDPNDFFSSKYLLLCCANRKDRGLYVKYVGGWSGTDGSCDVTLVLQDDGIARATIGGVPNQDSESEKGIWEVNGVKIKLRFRDRSFTGELEGEVLTVKGNFDYRIDFTRMSAED